METSATSVSAINFSTKLNQIYYIIYKTTNTINKLIYIGQHCQETSGFDGYLGSGKYIKRAIKKYGKENFIRETIEYCTSATIDEREIYWIGTLNSTNRNIGYNLSSGGEGIGKGFKHSEEFKIKRSNYMKGNTITKGLKHTENSINKMKQKQAELKTWTGRKHKKSSLEKMSRSLKGRIISDETKAMWSKNRKGKSKSEEHKRKIGEANKGRIISKESRIKTSQTLTGKYVGYDALASQFYYILDNNKDFYTFFNKTEKQSIRCIFNNKKSNTIIYKGITITRTLKNPPNNT